MKELYVLYDEYIKLKEEMMKLLALKAEGMSTIEFSELLFNLEIKIYWVEMMLQKMVYALKSYNRSKKEKVAEAYYVDRLYQVNLHVMLYKIKMNKDKASSK